MTELVSIPSPGVALEYGDRGAPLVVVVHDWFGRLPGLEFFADALSKKGFRVLVPDLYNGVATTDEAAAHRLFTELDVATALATIDDTIRVGRAEGSKKVGLVGFSVGGWLMLLHAQNGSADAVVAYYASLEPSDHGIIPAPVLMHLAEIDEWGAGQEPGEEEGVLGGAPLRRRQLTDAGAARVLAVHRVRGDAAAAPLRRPPVRGRDVRR